MLEADHHERAGQCSADLAHPAHAGAKSRRNAQGGLFAQSIFLRKAGQHSLCASISQIVILFRAIGFFARGTPPGQQTYLPRTLEAASFSLSNRAGVRSKCSTCATTWVHPCTK